MVGAGEQFQLSDFFRQMFGARTGQFQERFALWPLESRYQFVALNGDNKVAARVALSGRIEGERRLAFPEQAAR